jgi:hypothetical protein
MIVNIFAKLHPKNMAEEKAWAWKFDDIKNSYTFEFGDGRIWCQTARNVTKLVKDYVPVLTDGYFF